ncbi:hypothetical protein RUM44_007853 [Polyplax serrata]|uniref:Uncharacterized protein n=1 Tax=Polyplax serrata TaxID=468196 RepID=A0ABR1BAP8_POLSC
MRVRKMKRWSKKKRWLQGGKRTERKRERERENGGPHGVRASSRAFPVVPCAIFPAEIGSEIQAKLFKAQKRLKLIPRLEALEANTTRVQPRAFELSAGSVEGSMRENEAKPFPVGAPPVRRTEEIGKGFLLMPDEKVSQKMETWFSLKTGRKSRVVAEM